MPRAASLLVVILMLGAGISRGADPAAATNAAAAAQDLATATAKGDFAKAVDATYDTVVKEMGGREKAIKAIEDGFRRMKDQKMTLSATQIGTPGEVAEEGGLTAVVIPTTVEMHVPGSKVVAHSYLLGLSSDGGKTWKFIDGALADPDARAKILPKLPAKIVLPQVKSPEVTKE